MSSQVLHIGMFVAAFILLFEASLAWLCAALARIADASVMCSVKLLVFEALIPVPVAVIIGYAVGCVVGGPAGVQWGILSGVGFATYLFLAIARSVYETSYARAALFCLIFLALNLTVCFTVSFSPTVNTLRETIIHWPK